MWFNKENIVATKIFAERLKKNVVWEDNFPMWITVYNDVDF